MDRSGILLDVVHSRRTTQKRQTKKPDMANSRATTLNASRTSKFLRLTYAKHNKLTIQHNPLVTLSNVLDAAKVRKLPKKK